MKSDNLMKCNRCGHIFNIKDAAISYRQYANIQIRDKKCPLCGSSFSACNLPKDLDKYLYVDKDERYYSYKDKGGN